VMSSDTEGLKHWLAGQLKIPSSGLVVDAGCGQGEDILAMAKAHPATSFLGLDRSDWRGAETVSDFPSNLAFQIADLAEPMPLQDASVDALYSINVLECLADPSRFLRECGRVVRPGGQIVLGHFDWDTQTFDGEDRDLVRRMVHCFSDWKQAWMDAIDPWTGRRLRRLFAENRQFEGEVRAFTLISTSFEPGSYGRRQAESFEALVRRDMVTREDYEAFKRFQEQAAARNGFMFSVTLFAFVGTRLLTD